ncbi:MAG: hypothetical protein BRC28_02010, partial [Nanohaloarchaea archaeon SW_4_43_9]
MKLKKIREKADREAESLELPESIRTPGRTWTRYPDNLKQKLGGAKDKIEPEIETEGDVDIYTGKEGIEKAGDKAFDLIKYNENSINALHASNVNSFIYAELKDSSELHIKYSEESPV